MSKMKSLTFEHSGDAHELLCFLNLLKFESIESAEATVPLVA